MEIFELYKKCIKGECTAAEAARVEDWLRENPDAFESEMLSEMRAMGETGPMPEGLRGAMLAHFSSRGVPVETMREKGLVRRISGWVAAAVLLGAMLTGVWLYRGQDRGSSGQVWASIDNAGGGVKLVILPDSSRIWMNAHARIRYTIDDKKATDRLIELTGEAYFKVRTQAGRSFTVIAGNTRTRVLGTEFNIEAYPNEDMVRVVLEEGKVQVNSVDERGATRDSRLLEPGQAAVYRKAQRTLAVGRAVPIGPQDWSRDGELLNDVPLTDALMKIGRRYDKKIVFDSTKAGRYGHIKASFGRASIDQVLAQLGFTCNFKVIKDSNLYTISFNK